MSTQVYPDAEDGSEALVTYALLLEDSHYYVGRTSQLHHRLNQHWSGEGAKWTRLHPPCEVLDVLSGDQERRLTGWYMRTYGTAKVRGWAWSAPNREAQRLGAPFTT